ncbi:DUF1338 domain-containing protein [Bermanella marisrubri]|uniref:2-oxoadipate dioxygenase/decarboxylase n=1 Tax=Bermanella marisrubri TaxID=207949 RepID=Q1MZV0_9GAMM|nr:DUF1338 domain-containing protein [Bermanella marisrubri]EAT11457.1 hypothetical protein RED65_04600 [Oceanobacter sp. RED65] [Bermanella marisrubri]QIZ85035.1 DUF1338 domain-containing protein [Bermanella marisrubri]
MHNHTESLFAGLWQDYVNHTPSAMSIHELLGATQDKPIINDHIALRTFNHDKVNLDKLAEHFIRLGYKEGGEYHFKAKKLYAKHFEHEDPTLPKVFISQLLCEQLSEQAQHLINQLVDSVDEQAYLADDFLYSGIHWSVERQVYETLAAESEYAAWMSAWGFRANHFTVSINELEQYDTIEAVNQKLKDSGYTLNSAGGEIKGSPEVLLEQSSTMADTKTLDFSDGQLTIPSCFYEFALRYKKPDGKLYSGFVEASADKIFESTNKAD